MKSITLATPFIRNTGLALAIAFALGACGQKGPLIVEPSDPLPVDALQEDAAQVETERDKQIDE